MKRVFFLLFQALAVLCLTAGAALAQPAEDGKEDRFARMDTNKDGKVVYEELKAAFPDMREEAFTVIDKNKDKGIEREEWNAFMKNHAADTKGAEGTGGCPASSHPPLVTPPDGK